MVDLLMPEAGRTYCTSDGQRLTSDGSCLISGVDPQSPAYRELLAVGGVVYSLITATASAQADADTAEQGLAGVRSEGANYTLVLADAGRAIVHPAADAHDRSFTVDTIENTGWTGTPEVTFFNPSANGVTLTPATDVNFVRLDGTAGTGALIIGANSTAKATMYAADTWGIEGSALSAPQS